MGAVVLGDVVAPKERGRYYAYFAVVYTTAGALGPALGGFLSDHLHWSAIFWFNILLGFTALAVTGVLLRRLPRHERPHRLDVIGAMLIVTASVSFMLAINLGGVRYPWTSPPILALFALAAVVGFLFVRRLLTAPEPLIPIAILRNRQVRCATGAHAFGWSSIVGAQHLHAAVPAERHRADADRRRPDARDLHDRAQHQRRHVGLRARPRGALQAAADGRARGRDLRRSLVLAWNVDRVSLIWFEVLLVVIGLGFGAMPGLTQVVVQNSVERHQLGISVGTMTFTRNLLATFMVAVFGAIVAGFAISGRRHRRARRRAGAGRGDGGGSLPAGVLRDRGDHDGGADLPSS